MRRRFIRSQSHYKVHNLDGEALIVAKIALVCGLGSVNWAKKCDSARCHFRLIKENA